MEEGKRGLPLSCYPSSALVSAVLKEASAEETATPPADKPAEVKPEEKPAEAKPEEKPAEKVEPPKRTPAQNDHIHPLVREIANDAGRPTDEESLRVLRYLLLEAWRNETRRPPMFERSLDGMRLVDVSRGTSELDRPDCSEFLEWLQAWKVMHEQVR